MERSDCMSLAPEQRAELHELARESIALALRQQGQLVPYAGQPSDPAAADSAAERARPLSTVGDFFDHQ